ncbi:UNVERIFIED_CONTAM: hypothetical protein Sangu_2941100 [Sesamum angustifolium]|uniref:Uncharacterized protein n=1 Tax=Sesamum angustifolium TaxID=2727405 RepID=A0AAW2IK92_9LAMI
MEDDGLLTRRPKLSDIDSPASELGVIADHHQTTRLVPVNLLSPLPMIFINSLDRPHKIALPMFVGGRALFSSSSDGGFSPEHHRRNRLAVRKLPLHSETAIGAPSKVPYLAVESCESAANSAESTQRVTCLEREQLQQELSGKHNADLILPKNSFAEAIESSNITKNPQSKSLQIRHMKHHHTETFTNLLLEQASRVISRSVCLTVNML